MNTTFCETCRDDVTFSVEFEIVEESLKGSPLLYTQAKACCDNCKNEVFVPEIEERNLKAIYDVYRVKHHIISLEKILEIPEKYNIGKRPLSLLLGWGETTFARYCDGDMPTKQYSDTLKIIYEEPGFYKSILQANKDIFKSQLAYEKSLRKVEELLGED